MDLGKVVAIAFSILLITGAIAPAAMASESPFPSDSPERADSGDYSQKPDGDEPRSTTNESALAVKRTAYAQLALLEGGNRFDDWRKERADTWINGTFGAYRGADRVTSESVFRDDARAVYYVAGLSDVDPRGVDETTRLLATADAKTANASIQDAHRALEHFGEDIDGPGQRRAAHRHVENAERAYERGMDTLDTDEQNVESVARARAHAVMHFETAWRHSQKALDRIDRESDPHLEIGSRADPPRDGSEPVNTTISGTVFAVRHDDLENVTVVVDGDEPIEVELTAPDAPVSNATFAANVTLVDRKTRIEATLVEEDHLVDRNTRIGKWRGKWKKTERKHGRRGGSRHDERSIGDELLLDGDGVPDTYERRVTGTDPFAFDSDSNRTATDESGDDILDGGEDFDDDAVITYREHRLGLDPFDSDTDGDHLSDGFELRYSFLDPLDPDSDGDGVIDGDEDPDGDGLSIATEAELDTDPVNTDTDRDGLDDGRERDLGTDPLEPDTDGDGLTDYEELELGTDPLDPDTDGDGTPDGEETYRTETTNEETGVSIAVEGSGLAENTVSVADRPQYHDGTTASAGPTVYAANSSPVDSTTVALPVAEDATLDDVAVYRWGGTNASPWERVETTVDRENRTAEATVSELGYLTVLNATAWRRATTAPAPEPIEISSLPDGQCVGDCAVDGPVLVVGGEDTETQSMEATSLEPESFKSAASNDTKTVSATMFPNRPCLKRSVVATGTDDDFSTCDPLDDGDGDDGEDNGEDDTETGDGENGEDDSEGDDDDDSGGDWDGGDGDVGGSDPTGPDCSAVRDDAFRATCEDSGEEGTTFDVHEGSIALPDDVKGDIAIRLGYKTFYESSDATAEVRVANGGGLTRQLAPPELDRENQVLLDVSQLDGQTADIAVMTVDAKVTIKSVVVYRDTDGDGLYDHHERSRLTLPYGTGEEFRLDPTDRDTDGDGLWDGREVSFEEVYWPASPYSGGFAIVPTRKATSHPAKANTDGAGLNDFDEVRKGSNPWQTESLSITAKIPTVYKKATNGMEPMKKRYTSGGTQNAWEVPLDGADRWNSNDGIIFEKDKPDWLKEYHTKKDQDYYRIDGYLSVNTNEYVAFNLDDYREDLPAKYDIDFKESEYHVVDIVIENAGENLGPGKHDLYFIVKQAHLEDGDERCENSLQLVCHIGEMEMGISMDKESIFHHKGLNLNQGSNLQWDSNGLTYMTDDPYGMGFTPKEDYGEHVGVGAEHIETIGEWYGIMATGGTATEFIIITKSARLAVYAAGLEIIPPAVTGVDADSANIIKTAYSGSTTAFLNEEIVDGLTEGEAINAFSGGHVVFRN